MTLETSVGPAPEALPSTTTREAAGFDERWAAWQAKGAAHDRAVRRKMAIAGPLVIAVGAAWPTHYSDAERGQVDGVLYSGESSHWLQRACNRRGSNVADSSVIRLRHFPETAHILWTPSLKQRGTHDGHHSHART
jgi:hypothetical protein